MRETRLWHKLRQYFQLQKNIGQGLNAPIGTSLVNMWGLRSTFGGWTDKQLDDFVDEIYRYIDVD